MGQPDQHHINSSMSIGRNGDLTMAFQGDLPGADKTRQADILSQACQCRYFMFGQIGKLATCGLTRCQMNELKHIGEHHLCFGPAAGGLCQSGHRRGGITFQHMADNIEGVLPSRLPQQIGNMIITDGIRRQCRRLIEHRQRITHRAFGSTGNPGQCRLIGGDPFLAADIGQMACHHFDRHTAQIKPLTARQHRHRHFSDFGCGKDEFYRFRRLLKCFQERVEGTFGKHVHFVDNIDLVTCRQRPVADALNNLTHIIDAGIAGSIHFDDIDMTAFGNPDTG